MVGLKNLTLDCIHQCKIILNLSDKRLNRKKVCSLTPNLEKRSLKLKLKCEEFPELTENNLPKRKKSINSCFSHKMSEKTVSDLYTIKVYDSSSNDPSFQNLNDYSEENFGTPSFSKLDVDKKK